MNIVVIGSVFIDIKGYPHGTYIPQGRNSGRVEQVIGGVGRNVAEDIANMGITSTFVSLVDDSGLGKDAISKLKMQGIDTSYMRQVEDGMGTWLAVFDHNGDVIASISKRPDMSALTDILENSGDEIFRNSDSIVLQLDMEIDTVKKTFQLAEKYGKDVYAVISNISIIKERMDYLTSLGCVVCNRQEAGILFSEDYAEMETEEMIETAAEKVRRLGLKRLVITMGEDGAVYAEADGEKGFCSAEKVKVIDTTGAGDSFLAGVAAGLTYGKTLPESCEIGSRLAASVICTSENVCPKFLPEEFGISNNIEVKI